MLNTKSLYKSVIYSERYRKLLRVFPRVAIAIYKMPIPRKIKKASGRAAIYIAYKFGDNSVVEQIFLAHTKRYRPSVDFVDKYIAAGSFKHFETIASSSRVTPEIASIIRAGALQAEGRADEAIALLTDVDLQSFLLRRRVALTLRNIHRQKHDHGKAAAVMMRFLESEEGRVLISLGVSTAASADAANEDGIFVSAISRVLADIERLDERRKLFKQHWREAVAGCLAIFDIQGAIRIARRAKARGLKAGKVLAETQALRDELAPILHVVSEAHADILARCGRADLVPHDVQAMIIVPGAAVRTNKRDYPGFRSDIRTCLKAIVQTLESESIRFGVKGRIWNHGSVDCDFPFFSYHTVSDKIRGLHFKETDRPSLFSFDERGYAGWSAFSQTPFADLKSGNLSQDAADSFFEQDRQRMVESRISKYTQQDVKEKLPQRFIFVALQVMGDAVQSLAYTTPFAMLDEIIMAAQKRDLGVVVKRHPACKSVEIGKYLEDRRKAGDIVVTLGNIHDLIPASQAVCVVNSGVGAEALIYEKPVFVFGRSDYMGACFVCKNEGDFEKWFSENRTQLTGPELRKFWYFYRNKYACDLTNASDSSRWIAERVRGHLRHHKLGADNV